jgi:GAF domain-containing protein
MNLNLTQQQPLPFSARDMLEQLCQHRQPLAIFEAWLPALGQQLNCDRIFLYLRSPRHQVGRVPVCWRHHPEIPLVYDPDWKAERRSLPDQDPLFAAALEAHPSLFIEDVETAPPEQVNREFEHQTFGHRALIHAHLCVERKLWGILQAAIFEQPRVWSQDDRHLIEHTVAWMTPLAMAYVQETLPEHPHPYDC